MLKTEMRNPATTHIDQMSPLEMVTVIQAENRNAVNSIDATLPQIAEAVGVGAIVFYYLSGSRIKDINFVMEDALNFDGNTGPYVQYTYVRTCAVLRRAEGVDVQGSDLAITAPDEATLLKVLARFPEKVSAAIAEYEPSVITRYILDVCAAFNRFYHNCQIIGADDPAVRATRVAITSATNVVLGNAFPLICLKTMEQI